MSRLKAGLIIIVAALLFGGVAIFYFWNGAKTNRPEETKPVSVVAQEGVGQIPGTCIKPKTFVVTQQEKIEGYRKTVEAAIQQARERGASEADIKQQTEQLTKSLASIALTEQPTQVSFEDQPEYFQLNTEQIPGKAIILKHVELKKSGFVIVSLPLGSRVEDTKFSATHFLSAGVHNDLAVPLDRYMDRNEAYVSLYEDDGDQTFDRSKDRMLTYRKKGSADVQAFDDPALVKVRFKSDRSLDQYQSVYLQGSQKWEGLGTFEQVPGSLVTLSVARSYVPAWVALHESNNGCAGKVLGTYAMIEEPDVIALAKKSGTYTPELAKRYEGMHRQKDSFDIPLSREVKNETVIAILYEDNGDGRFDLTTDKPMKGINDEAVGIVFPVISGR